MTDEEFKTDSIIISVILGIIILAYIIFIVVDYYLKLWFFKPYTQPKIEHLVTINTPTPLTDADRAKRDSMLKYGKENAPTPLNANKNVLYLKASTNYC